LDEAVRIVNPLVSESVNALANATNPFPIAAKLSLFGPMLVPALERLFGEPLSDDTRNHVAALLSELGSDVGVRHLLSLLRRRDQNYSVMASLVLGKARVREAAPLIIGVLEEWDCTSDPYSAATLVEALNRLDALPQSLKERIRQQWPSNMRPGLDEIFRE